MSTTQRHTIRILRTGMVVALFLFVCTSAHAAVLSSENFKVIPKGDGRDDGLRFSSENYSITVKAPSRETDGGSKQGSKTSEDLSEPDFSVLPSIVVGTQRENIVPKNNVPLFLRDNVLNEEYDREYVQNSKLSEVNIPKNSDTPSLDLRASVFGALSAESLQSLLGKVEHSRTARAVVLGGVLLCLWLIRTTRIGKLYSPF